LLGYKKEYFEIGYSKTSQPPRHIILTGFSRLLIFGNSYILGYRQDSQELWVPYAAGHRHFFSTNCPNQLWNPPRLVFSGC